VLAAPAVQVGPFPVEQEWVTAVNGIPQDTYIDWLRSCSRITVTGHPAVSVPAGFTAGGLPVGLPLADRYGTDDRLLSIARAVAPVLLSPNPPALYHAIFAIVDPLPRPAPAGHTRRRPPTGHSFRARAATVVAGLRSFRVSLPTPGPGRHLPGARGPRRKQPRI
jgi:hypothetical protein